MRLLILSLDLKCLLLVQVARVCYNDNVSLTVYSSVRKEGTFNCEIVMELYIYLRNTQKQLKISSHVRNKSFVEFYLVYNGVCFKLLGSLL